MYNKTHYFVCPRPKTGAGHPASTNRPTFLILKGSAMTRASDNVLVKKTSMGKTKPNDVTAAKDKEV